eukprot:3821128-Alexandrium_andersonii.AAC.1
MKTLPSLGRAAERGSAEPRSATMKACGGAQATFSQRAIALEPPQRWWEPIGCSTCQRAASEGELHVHCN